MRARHPAPLPTLPERWRLDAGDAALATLHVPADLQRERTFEIACAMTVRSSADAVDAWHQMAVSANGALQWRRRITTSNPGSSDGLDYRFRRSVPVGQALTVAVACELRGGRRASLVIEADEC
ncbi:MAG: hypothetical protein Q8N44_01890 [Rubrivivax sp.]|nr:hypothetical protein [Rubrivivax sp.]